MEQNKNYTIDDIAKEMGVSKTTVSRALSGKGRIGKETARRIKEFAREHNFSPNVMARGLAQSKTYNIALMLPPDFGENEISFFKECMNGICKVAGVNDYDVLISMMESQLERMVINHKVDGVILSRSMIDAKTQKYLKTTSLPFVVVGSGNEENVHYIDNDNRKGCKDITEILLLKGMKKLALIGGDETHQVTESRKAGFEDALKAQNIPVDNDCIYMNVDSYIKASKAVNKAIESGCQCIVCMDDYVCNLVLEALHVKKISVPRDIKVASFYDSKMLEHNNPAITSLHFNTKILGQKAGELMLSLLGEDVGDETGELGYQVILRESTN